MSEHYNTVVTNKQKNLIAKYVILGYSDEDIYDRMLFSELAETFPIIYDDVEAYINLYRDRKLNKDNLNSNPNLYELLASEDKYDAYIDFKIIPRLDRALDICKELKKEPEKIKW